MNLLGIVCLFLQTSVVPPSAVTVVSPEKSVSISVLPASKGNVVSARRLAEALGGSVQAASKPGRFTFTASGRKLEFLVGSPFVRTDEGDLIQLGSAPNEAGGELFLPWEFVASVMGTLISGVKYDAKLARLSISSTAFAVKAETASVKPTPKKKRLIVVDAGHGGVDPGMRGPIGGGPKIQEKDITLAVSKLVEKHLKDAGFEVLLTRRKDTLIALADRGRIANRASGDLFLSIHVNAVGSRGVRGFETYFLAEAKTAEAARVEQMENEVVRFETEVEAPKGDKLNFIIKDMAQNEHLRESNEFAQFVQDELAKIHPGPNRGVHQANFAVLRGSFMPAVLIELGFGSNASEAKFLASPKEQDSMAAQIAKSVIRYMEKYEARLKAGGA